MKNKIKRHYYIDFIRGIAFFLMAIDHLLYNIASLFNGYWANYFAKEHYLNVVVRIVQSYRRSDISGIIRLMFISGVFLFISGVSAHFSKNNKKRGLKLLGISLVLSMITYIISLLMDNRSIIIYFGILHCISIGMLFSPIFEKVNKYVLFVLSFAMIGLGFYFATLTVNTIFLIPLSLKPLGFATADYYPLLPYLGIYLLGFLFGHWYFKIKKKPRKTKIYKNNIITYFGKNTLIWYFLHQVILVVFLVLFTLINLLFV